MLRRFSARALLCRAVSYWRWSSRGSSTRARAALAVTREARGTSIDGLRHPKRAWGLAPTSRAQHRRVMVLGAAPSKRARAIVPAIVSAESSVCQRRGMERSASW